MTLLERILVEEYFKREMLRQETLLKAKAALKKLREKVFFERAYIFGSIVRSGDYTFSSDVDIAFEGLESDKFFYAVAFLSAEIGKRVDVIELEKAPIFLRNKIVKEGVLWKPD
ncbi:MAG: hypothetical protein DRJ52_05180 [Thermoprotei archaeon]|nr:MAG: hypothetical protein DRJ52_05180 [Thermoprotei archaeon]RLF00079.1 MAG: hypothetical protein DRJ63_03555 [Thermoprotei archaeon]HDI75374.1 nucleotidyltransferase domain-containing protein [Thermoprotei archaeon]